MSLSNWIPGDGSSALPQSDTDDARSGQCPRPRAGEGDRLGAHNNEGLIVPIECALADPKY